MPEERQQDPDEEEYVAVPTTTRPRTARELYEMYQHLSEAERDIFTRELGRQGRATHQNNETEGEQDFDIETTPRTSWREEDGTTRMGRVTRWNGLNGEQRRQIAERNEYYLPINDDNQIDMDRLRTTPREVERQAERSEDQREIQHERVEARYELRNEEHQKFWEIIKDGNTVSLHWGRIGTRGQYKQNHFSSPRTAEVYAQRKAHDKFEEGYSERGTISTEFRAYDSEIRSENPVLDTRRPVNDTTETTLASVATSTPTRFRDSMRSRVIDASRARAEDEARREPPQIESTNASEVNFTEKIYNAIASGNTNMHDIYQHVRQIGGVRLTPRVIHDVRTTMQVLKRRGRIQATERNHWVVTRGSAMVDAQQVTSTTRPTADSPSEVAAMARAEAEVARRHETGSELIAQREQATESERPTVRPRLRRERVIETHREDYRIESMTHHIPIPNGYTINRERPMVEVDGIRRWAASKGDVFYSPERNRILKIVKMNVTTGLPGQWAMVKDTSTGEEGEAALNKIAQAVPIKKIEHE